MKTPLCITVAGLISCGIVGAAQATTYHLTPEGKNFTGSGNTSATKGGVTLACTASFKGNIDNTGVGHVTSGSFTGALGCTSVTLSGLPWTAVANNRTKGTIENVAFDSPIGNCGPSNLPVTLKNGVISFSNVPLAGGCTVSGTITTKPRVRVVAGPGAWWSGACSHMHCSPAWREQSQ